MLKKAEKKKDHSKQQFMAFETSNTEISDFPI